MSEEIAQLAEFQKTVRGATLHDDALGITERAVGRLQELKAQIESLSKRPHYESWMSEFTATEDDGLQAELDAVTMEDYKAKFTQKNYQEELSQYFPLLHRIMSEANKVDLEAYVSETDQEQEQAQESVSETIPPGKLDQAFAEWAEDAASMEFNAAKLAQALQELPQPLTLSDEMAADEVVRFFSEYGVESPELSDNLKDQARINPGADPIKDVIMPWAMKPENQEKFPGLSELFQSMAQPAPEQQPVAEDRDMKAMIGEVARIVKSFYNRDNPNVGPFRSEEGIAIDVEKEISEKFGDEAGHHARVLAEKFMAKLTQEWAQRHRGDSLMGEKGVAEGVGGWSGPLYDPALQGNGKKQRYEMMFKNGQVKRFSAMNDNEARKIAAGHGAKSVIKMKGNVPGDKIAEQGVAEGIMKSLASRLVKGAANRQTPQEIANTHVRALNQRAPGTRMQGHPNFADFKREVHSYISAAQNGEQAFARTTDDHVKSLFKKYFSEGVAEGYSTLDLWNMSPKEVIELLDAKKITYDDFHAYQELVIQGGPDEGDDFDYTDYSMRQGERGMEENINGIELNGKMVDSSTLEVDGVDPGDHPDYVDAYFSSGEYTDGTPLSDEDLAQLTDLHGDLVNQIAHGSYQEGMDADDQALEAMSRHAKGYEKYGKKGMDALRRAAQDGAGEEKMDKIRDKHDRYDEEVDMIRKLAGMAK